MDFFPSISIHEDDTASGEFHLKAEGCSFELTQYNPTYSRATRVRTTIFDLSYYETDPTIVYESSFYTPLSSRRPMRWVARGITEADTEIKDINSILWKARLSLRERRDLDSPAVIEKLLRLEALLEQVEDGEFGQFSTDNHVKSYVIVDSAPLLIGVYISTEFSLPVKRADTQGLVAAMDKYRATYCAEN